MTSLELLQEIDAWLSFNNSPSKEQISELRNDIKKHISEQLRIHDVSVRSEHCNHKFERVEKGGEFQGNQCDCGEWEDLT